MDGVSTYYEALNVPETASAEEIRSSYSRLAHTYHPDKLGEAVTNIPWVKQEAEERFRQIHEAWNVLRDPHKRRQYDEQLNAIRQGEQVGTAGVEEQYEDDEDEPFSTPYWSPSKGAHTVSQTPTPPPTSPTPGISPAVPTASKRILIVMGCLLFVGILMVGIQAALNNSGTQQQAKFVVLSAPPNSQSTAETKVAAEAQQPAGTAEVPSSSEAQQPAGTAAVMSSSEYGIGAAQESALTIVLDPGNSRSIWTTSVYSYAHDGGPGGGLDNDQLRIGGWGDEYWSLLQFDLSSDPKHADRAILQLYNEDINATPTPFDVYVIDQDWGWARGDRLWWRDRPTEMHRVLSVSAPQSNSWVSIDITDVYNNWQSGTPNYGIALRPLYTNNNFDRFRSSKFADETYRPKLLIMAARQSR